MTAYPSYLRQPNWRSRRQVRPSELTARLAGWLFDTGSLTSRLIEASDGDFHVQVRRQGWGRPRPDEARILGIPRHSRVWLREVRLICRGRSWVFARTVAPRVTLIGHGWSLTRLGSRSLGARLFADPRVRRGPMQVARLLPGQFLYDRALDGRAEVPVWVRRSLFYRREQPLLVCELFLPPCPAYENTQATHSRSTGPVPFSKLEP